VSSCNKSAACDEMRPLGLAAGDAIRVVGLAVVVVKSLSIRLEWVLKLSIRVQDVSFALRTDGGDVVGRLDLCREICQRLALWRLPESSTVL
jgi:hypothetical protein